jgi:DNA-binding XRE family transcriptional regulator
MPQTAQPASQELRAEVIRIRRAGLPVNDATRRELAARYGVSQRMVTAVRQTVDGVLAAARASDGANRRTVEGFDGDHLRELRQGGAPGGHWLTQYQLGQLAGRSRGEIGHLENGHRRPTIITLNAIADALGVRPSELIIRVSNGQAPAP